MTARRLGQLIVLLVVFGLGVAAGIWQSHNSIARHREAVQRASLFQIRDAIDQFYADAKRGQTKRPDIR